MSKYWVFHYERPNKDMDTWKMVEDSAGLRHRALEYILMGDPDTNLIIRTHDSDTTWTDNADITSSRRMKR